MLTALNELNVLAVIIGGFLYMIYGGIYYSIRLGGDQHTYKKHNEIEGPMKYIFSGIVAFISSFIIAILVEATGANDFGSGMLVGFMVGFIITLVYIKNRLFGLMTNQSLMIAMGDHLVIFIILGALHGFMS